MKWKSTIDTTLYIQAFCHVWSNYFQTINCQTITLMEHPSFSRISLSEIGRILIAKFRFLYNIIFYLEMCVLNSLKFTAKINYVYDFVAFFTGVAWKENERDHMQSKETLYVVYIRQQPNSIKLTCIVISLVSYASFFLKKKSFKFHFFLWKFVLYFFVSSHAPKFLKVQENKIV